MNPLHGLIGKESNRAKPFNATGKQSLHVFFDKIKEFGKPTATQFISSETGNKQVRDADKEKIFLPPIWTKRYLYRQ